MTTPISLPDQQREYALTYLNPDPRLPWKWAEEGEGPILVWEDDATIVFGEELMQIFAAWPHDKLPPLGQFVLVLAALRAHVPSIQFELGPLKINEKYAAHSESYRMARKELHRRISFILDRLEELPQLCVGLVNTPEDKAVLCHMLITDQPIAARDPVVDLLEYGLDLEELAAARPDAHGDLTRLLGPLEQPLSEFTREKLATRLRTGLERAPDPAEVAPLELPFDVRISRLLAEMQVDPQFTDFAKLCRDISAVLQLPQPDLEIDPNTHGGAADLANKGPLHRLLLTELAQDFDVLAARLAMNEALYLRLEPTAHPQGSSLTLLVDTGLRMWGRPRVFAAAVALSFAAKVTGKRVLSAFRPEGKSVAPVTLDTREGLLELLAALTPHSHPTAALQAITRESAPRDKKAPRHEVILVTHEDTLRVPEFAAALRGLAEESLILALVNRQGGLRVLLRERGNMRQLCALELDPHTLEADPLTREVAPAPTKLLPDHADLPACLRLPRLPFLLPVKGPLLALGRFRDGTWVGLNKAREIWLWSGRDQGAWRAGGYRMEGVFLKMILDPAADRLLIFHIRKDADGIQMDYFQFHDSFQDHTFHSRQIIDVKGHPNIVLKNGLLFFSFHDRVLIKGYQDTAPARVVLLEKRRYLAEGFFTAIQGSPGHPQKLEWLGLDGAEPKWFVENLIENPQIAWTRPGSDTLWVVTAPDRLSYFKDGQLKFVKQLAEGSAIGFINVSPDGEQLVFRHGPNRSQISLVETETMKSRHLKQWPDVLPVGKQACLNRTVRERFQHVSMNAQGEVWLKSMQGKWSFLNWSTLSLQTHRSNPTAPAVPFLKLPTPAVAEGEYTLHLADMGNGSRIYLDSRGLLHFVSPNPVSGDMSIVLTEHVGGGAVWLSDGLNFGNSFFGPKHENTDRNRIPFYVKVFARHFSA